MYHSSACKSPQKLETLLKNSYKECSLSMELVNAKEVKGLFNPSPTEFLSHNK